MSDPNAELTLLVQEALEKKNAVVKALEDRFPNIFCSEFNGWDDLSQTLYYLAGYVIRKERQNIQEIEPLISQDLWKNLVDLFEPKTEN